MRFAYLILITVSFLVACSSGNNSGQDGGTASSPLEAVVDSSGIITGHEVECDSTECSAEIDLVVE